jgi:hypothetical protein
VRCNVGPEAQQSLYKIAHSAAAVLHARKKISSTKVQLVCTEYSIRVDYVTESPNVSGDDRPVLPLPETLFASPFKSKSRLEAENAALRHQLIVLKRRVRGRVQLTNGDRLFLVQLYRWFPSVLKAITIIRPEILVRWHRAGFRQYWRWKSRSLGGRPKIAAELRALIRRMSAENPLWGAPLIHGELLKLGFEVAQSTVLKYMVPRRGRPFQTWKTFLRKHADGIAALPITSAGRRSPLGARGITHSSR